MKIIHKISLAVIALGLFSCNNDQSDIASMDEDVTLKSAAISINEVKVEAATAESAYEVEFFSNAEKTLSYWWRMGKKFSWNAKLRYRVNHCPNVTIAGTDGNEYPKTITLDYGEGTELKNGKVLSGIIRIEVSAPRKNENYYRTVEYQDFGVDTLLINGTSMVEMDKVDDRFRRFSSDLTIELPDGTVITRTSEKVWQWLAGNESDDDQEDDVVSISGADTVTVTWVDGGSDSYTKTILEPLKKISDCKYIVEGIVEVKLGGDVISIMDYGYAEDDADECDKWASLETSEGTEYIDLSERKVKNQKEKDRHNSQNGQDQQNGYGNQGGHNNSNQGGHSNNNQGGNGNG